MAANPRSGAAPAPASRGRNTLDSCDPICRAWTPVITPAKVNSNVPMASSAYRLSQTRPWTPVITLAKVSSNLPMASSAYRLSPTRPWTPVIRVGQQRVSRVRFPPPESSTGAVWTPAQTLLDSCDGR